MSNESSEIVVPESFNNTSSSSLRKDIFTHISTVTHVFTFGVVGYIIFLCFEGEFTFFTWHPFLYSIGWLCLMTEAILVVTPDNIFSKRLSFKLRVQYHWIIQVLAVGCSTAGLFIDVVNKNRRNKPHFKSWHGLIGLISMICCIPTCLNGLSALFNVELNKYIKPSINKLIHAVCGIVTFLLGSVAMILGLHTWWFVTKGNETSQKLCFVIIVFATVWTLVRPITTAFNRVKSLAS